MAYEEDWETGSGLALDGSVVTVTAAEFGFNANMGAGIVCLNLTLTTEDGEDIDQSFSVGGKFEANRDGSAIEGKGKINRNSNYGLLIESVKEIVDDPGSIIGSPKEAAGWVGTRWTFGTVERTTTNPTTGVEKVSSKFVVTEFHGQDADDTDDEPVAQKPAKKSSAKGKPAAKKSAKKGGIPDGIDADLWAELIELAGEHDEYEAFVDAALDVDGVAGDRAVQKAVMSTGDSGVWAAAGREV